MKLFKRKPSKAIRTIQRKIDKKYDEIYRHFKSRPSGESRCKEQEDEYIDRSDALDIEVKVLNEAYKEAIAVELNKFPLNKPCTIRHIADYMNVNDHIPWIVLIKDKHDRNSVRVLYDYGCSTYFNVISDSEIHAEFIYDGMSCEYNTTYYYTINLPNWRFVASGDNDIFYVERVA